VRSAKAITRRADSEVGPDPLAVNEFFMGQMLGRHSPDEKTRGIYEPRGGRFRCIRALLIEVGILEATAFVVHSGERAMRHKAPKALQTF